MVKEKAFIHLLNYSPDNLQSHLVTLLKKIIQNGRSCDNNFDRDYVLGRMKRMKIVIGWFEARFRRFASFLKLFINGELYKDYTDQRQESLQ